MEHLSTSSKPHTLDTGTGYGCTSDHLISDPSCSDSDGSDRAYEQNVVAMLLLLVRVTGQPAASPSTAETSTKLVQMLPNNKQVASLYGMWTTRISLIFLLLANGATVHALRECFATLRPSNLCNDSLVKNCKMLKHVSKQLTCFFPPNQFFTPKRLPFQLLEKKPRCNVNCENCEATERAGIRLLVGRPFTDQKKL